MPAVSVPNGGAAAADETVDLPLFDISKETPELGKAIVEAAAKWGFLWIKATPSRSTNGSAVGSSDGYDLDAATVDNVFNISARFFKDAPLAEKQACKITHNRGWVDMHVENLDPSKHKRGDFKQAFNLSEPIDGDWLQPMPATFVAEDAALRDFHARCRKMSTRILRLLALGLDITDDADWFVRSHAHAPNTSRLLYYPTLPADTDYDSGADIRAGAHSDYGSITLLFTRPGQPGLEILKPDGEWAGVPVFPPAYHDADLPPVVVNIGDLLSYWTNGLLRSTVHRVVLTTPTSPSSSSSSTTPSSSSNGPSTPTTNGGLGCDRFSIAIFVQPHADTELVAVPSAPVAQRAAQFAAQQAAIGHGGGIVSAERMRTLTAGEHLSGRLKATYGAVYEPEERKTAAMVAS